MNTERSRPAQWRAAKVMPHPGILLSDMKRHWLTTGLLLAMASQPTQAGGGTVAGTGGALEWTQELNYGQLLKNTVSQANLVAREVSAEIQRAQMLVNEATNLANAPASVVSQMVTPYQQMVSEGQNMLDQLDQLQTSYQQALQMVQQRYAEAQALGTTPAQYIALESGLAATRQGQYALLYAQDKATLQAVQARSESLQNAIDSGQLQSHGTVDGLDRLNALVAMVGGETQTLNRQIAQAEAARNLSHLNDAQNLLLQEQNQNQTIAVQDQETSALLGNSARPSGYHQQQIEQQAWAGK